MLQSTQPSNDTPSLTAVSRARTEVVPATMARPPARAVDRFLQQPLRNLVIFGFNAMKPRIFRLFRLKRPALRAEGWAVCPPGSTCNHSSAHQ